MTPALPLMVAAARADLAKHLATAPPEMATLLRGIGMILELVARDWDGAAVDRVAAIDALTHLLRRGVAIAPAPLAAALSDSIAPAGGTPDLRLSSLIPVHDRLLEALTPLQAWLEDAGGREAAALAHDLDTYLVTQADRRILKESAPW